MTRCEQCGREYHQADSCTWRHVEIDGQIYAREGEYQLGKEFTQTTNLEKTRCDDCGVLIGRIHHFGCTLEKCPRCGEILTTCACDNVFPRQ